MSLILERERERGEEGEREGRMIQAVSLFHRKNFHIRKDLLK